jgi:hypothetical protein
VPFCVFISCFIVCGVALMSSFACHRRLLLFISFRVVLSRCPRCTSFFYAFYSLFPTSRLSLIPTAAFSPFYFWITKEPGQYVPNVSDDRVHTLLPVRSPHPKHPVLLPFIFIISLFSHLIISPPLTPSCRYIAPPDGLKTAAERAEFSRRCWPSLDDIMQRVRRAREEWEEFPHRHVEKGMDRRDPDGGHYTNDTGPTDHGADTHRLARRKTPAHDTSTDWHLNTVYVANNGDAAWWDTITAALRAEGWEVRGSADMDFMRDIEYVHDDPSRLMEVEHEVRFMRDARGKERGRGGVFKKWVDGLNGEGERRARKRASEKVVGMAVDMEVAARAEVFIGNGVSGPFRLLMVHPCHVFFMLFWGDGLNGFGFNKIFELILRSGRYGLLCFPSPVRFYVQHTIAHYPLSGPRSHQTSTCSVWCTAPRARRSDSGDHTL